MRKTIMGIGSYEIELPTVALEDCYHQGRCDGDVDFWHRKIDWSEVGMTPDQIKYELSNYGAWSDEELNSIEENQKRILWIAAGNYQEDRLKRRLTAQ